MEELKRSRSASTGVITKWASQIQAILDRNQADITTEQISQLEARQTTLEMKLNECTTLNAAIWDQTPSTDPEMEDEMMAAEEFHMKLLTQINKIKRFLVQHNTPTVGTLDNASSSRSVSNNLKMLFHEQFMASVDSNASLPDIQKFNYLKSALTGEASQLISHLPLSNSNYQIALNSLTDRYDNPRLIVKTHLRAIFQLKPLQRESASELRKLIVASGKKLMAIQALKVDTVPCGFVWVDLLSEKLDAESRRQFELDYPGKDLQTLDQLREFINRRVQALEVSESRPPQSSFNNFKSSQEHRKS